MSTQTSNYQLSLREANDIFNPLSTNDNFTKIDELIFKQTMPQYTSVVASNLLTLSGTPTKQDTVFKFIATGAANTWSFSGSIYNIITPDGNQFTTESGKMYVGYVDENSMLVLLAWPAAVNAETFDNQPASYYATETALQSVNTTAANAVQTAQAAQTVANNALEVANDAGFKPVFVWSNPAPTSEFGRQTITTTFPQTAKYIVIEYDGSISSPGAPISLIFTKPTPTVTCSLPVPLLYGSSNPFTDFSYSRKTTLVSEGIQFSDAYTMRMTQTSTPSINNAYMVPIRIGYLN